MDVVRLLEQKLEQIVSDATEKMARSHLKHYEMEGSAQIRERLRMLCNTLLESLEKKSRTPMIRYAEKIGSARFSSGFALGEVQTAFNVLEESVWNQILEEMKPEEYANAVESINEMLRTGKDAVARIYFSSIASAPPWG
jgi:hypothetical protein